MYCWRTPTKHDVTLEVDHRISVKDWWWNYDENLITSCYDCNRGKRADSVIIWTDLEETKKELESVKERLEQIKYIGRLKDTIKKKKDEIKRKEYQFVWDLLSGYNQSFIRKVETRIKNQNSKYWISFEILEDCLHITYDKFSTMDSFYHDDFMKYFHGVLKNKIK